MQCIQIRCRPPNSPSSIGLALPVDPIALPRLILRPPAIPPPRCDPYDPMPDPRPPPNPPPNPPPMPPPDPYLGMLKTLVFKLEGPPPAPEDPIPLPEPEFLLRPLNRPPPSPEPEPIRPAPALPRLDKPPPPELAAAYGDLLLKPAPATELC